MIIKLLNYRITLLYRNSQVGWLLSIIYMEMLKIDKLNFKIGFIIKIKNKKVRTKRFVLLSRIWHWVCKVMKVTRDRCHIAMGLFLRHSWIILTWWKTQSFNTNRMFIEVIRPLSRIFELTNKIKIFHINRHYWNLAPKLPLGVEITNQT